MKLSFFNVDEYCSTLKSVTSNKIYSKRCFHPDGLFSEVIFGPVKTGTCGCGTWWGRSKFGETCGQCGVKISHSNVRRKNFAKIELPFPVMNPIMFYLISKVGKTTFETIINNLIFDEKSTYYFDEDKKKYIMVKLSDDRDEHVEPIYPEGCDVYSGYAGAYSIIKKEAEEHKDDDPDWKYIHDNMNRFYMSNIIVPPPEFRPVSKSKNVQMRDELNKFFLTILNFSLTMQQEDLDSVGNIDISATNFKYLQRHIFDLYEYIFGKFSKKTGLIRGFILGKRIDFSGRAVISPDPSLKLTDCSIPYLMILELFKLDIANILMEERKFKRYDPAIEYIDKCIDLEDYSLFDTAVKVTKGKYIMLNRQPTLHRMGIMSFQINVNRDYVIRIHPLICEPYNADFDGDQMAVYISLREDTERESKEKISISSNMISPASGKSAIGANQDIVLGLYYLTKDGETPAIIHDGIETTEGRVVFNQILPESFPFINEIINKKKLAALINVLVQECTSEELVTILDKIKDLGFQETTKRGVTMSLKNIQFNDAYDIVSEICDNNQLTIEEKYFALQSNDIKERLRNEFPYSDFIESGSRGSWDQAKQLTFCRGFISNSKGSIIPTPIKNNLLSGLNKHEFFISCYGSRKALLDVALNTGVSGYLTRKLVYCAVNLELDENLDDCGTIDTFNFIIPEQTDSNESIKLARSLIGRWIVEADNGVDVLKEITNDNYRDYIGKQVRLRTPIFCKNHKLCKKCYGTTSKYIHSKYVGIMAAQAMGEVATQLTLRTFHIGGIAQMIKGQGDENQKDIINDLTEVKKLFHGHGRKSYEQLVMDLFNIYIRHSQMLLVNFECIVSQMMRFGDMRWRLTEKRDMSECEIISIESVPSKESFLLALAFSRPYSYIMNGILGNTDSTDGILERIMVNDL